MHEDLWLNAVPDEASWRRLLLAWSAHLGQLWDHLGRQEAAWSWGERTSVGLIANAAVAAGGFAMVELPPRVGKTRERYDLWVSFGAYQGLPAWSCRAEAKHMYVNPTSLQTLARKAPERLRWAGHQINRLSGGSTRASLLVLTPNPRDTEVGTGEEALLHLANVAHELGRLFGGHAGTFLHSFRVPHTPVPLGTTEGLYRYYPGAILLGRVHKSE